LFGYISTSVLGHFHGARSFYFSGVCSLCQPVTQAAHTGKKKEFHEDWVRHNLHTWEISWASWGWPKTEAETCRSNN